MSAYAIEANRTHPRVPLRRCATEREFAANVLDGLSPWFKIDEQVYSTHVFGARLRIDAILSPLDPAE